MENWVYYRSVIDGEELRISGLNIWDHEWNNTRLWTTVKDPIYQQDRTMNIYTITAGETTITFAAGEFSNLVWGFYLPG
ncbi:hypothetical protein DYU05_02025 [Mucilaginibacter terrenus]|uniref:Uncharacterized protein n=1 Tax=Mucilaginibacter terrenus TaxID=2482727 RepID=A0A3E2NTS8_9SPHI|nr:hypothetical protein [Mucilaginibacter terrenus]RFZ84422.1 hypothetical protein DYU05_02025 [Mucilaginibacter terrenus]